MSCNSCSSSNGTPAGCKNNGTCGTDGCNKLTVFNWLENMEPIGNEDELKIFEVRFKNGRKQYYKNSNNLNLLIGDLIVVDAERGYDVSNIGALLNHSRQGVTEGYIQRTQTRLKQILEDIQEELFF